MATTVQLCRAETLHDDATICDFDELADSAKDSVASAARSNKTEVNVSRDTSSIFDSCDVVRFTGYYRIKSE